jgi:Transposase and inactivated derivatives
MEKAKRGRGRPAPRLVVTDEERRTLERYAHGRTVSQALALRSRIVLACGESRNDSKVAGELQVHRETVRKWRRRYINKGIDGLADSPRPNIHRKLGDDDVERVVRLTLQTKPQGATQWSTRRMARNAGVSQSSVSRVWRAFKLRPWRSETFTLSTDDFFVEKVRDIVGLYMNPPDRAVVLCVDEKSQIQALERTQPLLPMDFGQAEKRTHTYRRHGTTNLFAALDCATGKVIGECFRRKRASEFRRFLSAVDAAVPTVLNVHLVVDNSSIHGAPTIRRWLARHPRFQLHFVPTYSSWLNMVERWFASLTQDAIRRGSHCSSRDLEHAIYEYIDSSNQQPKPFIWTKSADQILAAIARRCIRTLALADI